LKKGAFYELFTLSLFLILLAAMLNARSATAVETTIYIKSDGSLEPLTVPISTIGNTTYVFDDNINGSIIVERSNIIIDGNGYTLMGAGSGTGFTMFSPTNVTIENITIAHFTYGIYMDGPSKVTITENTITNNSYGINFYRCSNNRIIGNVISFNNKGIFMSYSSRNNTIEANTVTANGEGGIGVWASSNGNRILHNEVSGNLFQTYAYGIMLSYASNTSICYNDVRNNYNNLVLANRSNYAIIMDNNIANGVYYDIYFYERISKANVSRNNITGSSLYGISLRLSSNSTFCKNNIMNNSQGISLFHLSANNTFYYNNFVGNANHATFYANYTNFWDNGLAGNYWDNYTGNDANGDGIGDTPRVMNPINIDHYPLMKPYAPLRGDLNDDDKVDGKDVAIISRAFASHLNSTRWNSQADLNGDGKIDGKDVVAVALNWGKKFP